MRDYKKHIIINELDIKALTTIIGKYSKCTRLSPYIPIVADLKMFNCLVNLLDIDVSTISTEHRIRTPHIIIQ